MRLTMPTLPHRLRLPWVLLAMVPDHRMLGIVLGPAVGLLVWWLPLGLEPVAHRALAIVGVMFVYWITEVLDHGLTALIGCLLFWLLHVAQPAVAFSGLSTPPPWFMLGGLLIGQATSQTGLAKRLGYYVVYLTRGSSTRLLLGFIICVCVLNLLLSPTAQLATLAPVAIGIVAALGLPSHSNMAKGLFLALSYVSTTCSKMILSGGATILASGIIEKQTGVQILWGQWFLAFLPLVIPTILAAWLAIRWLYPAEPPVRPLATWSTLWSPGVGTSTKSWSGCCLPWHCGPRIYGTTSALQRLVPPLAYFSLCPGWASSI